MRFYPLGSDGEYNKTRLSAEFQAAKKWGKLFLGEEHLFFRAGWFRIGTIPYSAVSRCFRRVQLIPIKLRGSQREIRVENLVVCGEAGELAQIQLPGAEAAKNVMSELEQKIPHAEFGKPAEDE